ncbi:MAG: YbaK/EbsC family protein [Candidatus Bipolaricaulia bacterium]
MEVAHALGVDPAQVFKTLVAKLDSDRLVVAVIPVSSTLDLKALATTFGTKRAAMASPSEAERARGSLGFTPRPRVKAIGGRYSTQSMRCLKRIRHQSV